MPKSCAVDMECVCQVLKQLKPSTEEEAHSSSLRRWVDMLWQFEAMRKPSQDASSTFGSHQGNAGRPTDPLADAKVLKSPWTALCSGRQEELSDEGCGQVLGPQAVAESALSQAGGHIESRRGLLKRLAPRLN